MVSNKVSRHPQRDFTEWLEKQKARKVLSALQIKTRNRGVRLDRDAAAYLSCNVGSCQFVGVLSMPTTRMDNVMYCECWSHYLGGPSPVCAPHVGHRFSFAKGKRISTVDSYGDNVVSACLPGDGWRVRHDNFKWSLADQAEWCRFMDHTEPVHKFLPFIRQRDIFLTKRARQRQGLIPDLLDVRGQRLMDIKGQLRPRTLPSCAALRRRQS